MVGAMVGPPTTHMAKNAIATPLVVGSYRSPKAAETLLIGADPKRPPRKRVMKIASAFRLTAVAMLKTPMMKTAGKIDTLRPYNSLIGAQRSGPNAKPAKRLVPGS